MMNCQQAGPMLPLYADGELDGRQRAEVERHVAACAECERMVAIDRELAGKLSGLAAAAKRIPVPATLRHRVMERAERRERFGPLWRVGQAAGNATALLVWLALIGLVAMGIALAGKPIVEQHARQESTPAAIGVDPPHFAAPRTLWEQMLFERRYELSPDGQWATYRRPSTPVSSATDELVAHNLRSGEIVTLLKGGMVLSFDWFANSHRVLLATARGQSLPSELLVKALGSEEPERVARAPEGASHFGAAIISPDGKRIAATVAYDASPAPVAKIGIEVMNEDGGDRRQIVEPDFFIGDLRWTPDGRQIAYFKGKGGTPPEDGEAYVVNATGEPAQPQLLLPRAKVLDWSPDGASALWASEPAGPNGTADLSVSKWPDIGQMTLVAQDASSLGATWADSSHWVIYARGGALYLAAADGTGEHRRLTDQGGRADSPAWLRDHGVVYRWQVDDGRVDLRLLPLQTLPPGGSLGEETPIPATAEPIELRSLHMLDATTGWALSDGAVLRTADGGGRWTDVTPSNLPVPYAPEPGYSIFTSSFFLDTQTAWVAVVDIRGCCGTAFRTTDGGSSWTLLDLPTGGGQIHFVDRQHGWFVPVAFAGPGSSPLNVYETADGGTSWQQVTSTTAGGSNQPGSLPFAGNERGVSFLKPSLGWASGEAPAPGSPWFYASEDGGHTWRAQDLPVPPEFLSSQIAVGLPLFFGERDATLPVRFTNAQGTATGVYVSRDGGKSWQATTVLAGAFAFDFVGVDDGWAWDGSGTLLRTRDGGKGWEQVTPNASLEEVTSFDFVNDLTGWAIGQGSERPVPA
jgi:photosystem II stability/assembly factor-like uncharacterized protein